MTSKSRSNVKRTVEELFLSTGLNTKKLASELSVSQGSIQNYKKKQYIPLTKLGPLIQLSSLPKHAVIYAFIQHRITKNKIEIQIELNKLGITY